MSMENFRSEIDNIDDVIVDLLGSRLEIVRKVAQFKKGEKVPVIQPTRIDEVKSRCKDRGRKYNVREGFIDDIYQMIIKEACQIEFDIMQSRQR